MPPPEPRKLSKKQRLQRQAAGRASQAKHPEHNRLVAHLGGRPRREPLDPDWRKGLCPVCLRPMKEHGRSKRA